MLLPRRLDQEGLRAYVDEVRPRFLVVRVRAGGRSITWGLPLSALEEIAAFVLGAVAFAHAARQWLPARWRTAMEGASNGLWSALRLGSEPGRASTTPSVRSAPPASTALAPPSPAAALWAAANDLAGGALRDVLRVPPGQPYVSVRSGATHIDVVAY